MRNRPCLPLSGPSVPSTVLCICVYLQHGFLLLSCVSVCIYSTIFCCCPVYLCVFTAQFSAVVLCIICVYCQHTASTTVVLERHYRHTISESMLSQLQRTTKLHEKTFFFNYTEFSRKYTWSKLKHWESMCWKISQKATSLISEWYCLILDLLKCNLIYH